MYQDGKGVSQNCGKAMKWYKKAANQGYAEAQYNSGVIYRDGEGVPQDNAEALRWYKKAAEQGFEVAQNNLGLMYAKGEGVPQNFVNAYAHWTVAAALNEDQDIRKNLSILTQKMSCPSQIFVPSEFIDKYACACQATTMITTLRNLVMRIWSKIEITSHLAAENLALRQQLAVMKRTNKRPKIRMTDRLFWVLFSRIWIYWRKSLVIVTPDTVVRWHRKGFKLFWKFKSKGPGRPQADREIRDLVMKMAKANPSWGAPRIHGELLRLGFNVSERTVSNLIPWRWPNAKPSQTWRTFLKNIRTSDSRIHRVF